MNNGYQIGVGEGDVPCFVFQESPITQKENQYHDELESKYVQNNEHAVTLNACRICLQTEGKLFPIMKYNLCTAFENLTGVLIRSEPQYPQQLCVECAHRLISCAKFRHKALTAHSLMTDVIGTNNQLKIEHLQSIRRDTSELLSNITVTKRSPDNFDLVIKEPDVPEDSRDEPIKIELQFGDQSDDFYEMEVVDDDKVSKPVSVFVNNKKNELIKLEDESTGQGTSKRMPRRTARKRTTVASRRTKRKPSNTGESLASKKPKRVLLEKFDDEIQESNDNDENNDNDKSDNDYNDKNDNDFTVNDNNDSDDSSDEPEKKKVPVKRGRPRVTYKKKKKVVPIKNLNLDSSIFTTTELTIEEQKAEIEQKMNSDGYKRSAFGCRECYMVCLNEDSLKRHMWKHTTEAGEHRCDICKRYYKSPRMLRKHVKDFHRYRYECKKCLFISSVFNSAECHQKMHQGVKYKCSHCPEEFTKPSSYMTHLRLKHPTDIACHVCGYSFVSEKGVDQHKRLKHRGENLEVPPDAPSCDLCNIRFMTPEALQTHKEVSLRHTDTKNKRNDPSRGKRWYVLRGRGGESSIPCEQCGLEMKSWREYHSHFRATHPDKNRTLYPPTNSAMCDQCGKMFQSQQLLIIHRRRHTVDKPYKCEECGKLFRNPQGWMIHTQRHRGLVDRKTYPCDVCGKLFISNPNRLRHQRVVHTVLRPVECEVCGKAFKTKEEKNNHFNHVHLNKPWPKRDRKR